MTAIIQSPVIGNALRQALDIDAAGGLPLAMEQLVLPVAVVADVRAQLNQGVVGYSNLRIVLPVAGQFSQCSLEIQAVNATRVTRVVPRRIQLRASGALPIYWRLQQGGIAGAVDAVPRRLDSALVTSQAAARVIGGTTAVAPNIAIAHGILYADATPVVWEPPIDVILTPDPTTNAALIFEGITANVGLALSCEWEEYQVV